MTGLNFVLAMSQSVDSFRRLSFFPQTIACGSSLNGFFSRAFSHSAVSLDDLLTIPSAFANPVSETAAVSADLDLLSCSSQAKTRIETEKRRRKEVLGYETDFI
jgi:hypothetical protein